MSWRLIVDSVDTGDGNRMCVLTPGIALVPGMRYTVVETDGGLELHCVRVGRRKVSRIYISNPQAGAFATYCPTVKL